MNEFATTLPAISLGRVIEGDRVRFGVGFDLRGRREIADAHGATIWVDLGPLAELPRLELLDSSSGRTYGADATHRAGQLLGISLNAAALADLHSSCGAFFTMEGEFCLADRLAVPSVTPRFCQLTVAGREDRVAVAA